VLRWYWLFYRFLTHFIASYFPSLTYLSCRWGNNKWIVNNNWIVCLFFSPLWLTFEPFLTVSVVWRSKLFIYTFRDLSKMERVNKHTTGQMRRREEATKWASEWERKLIYIWVVYLRTVLLVGVRFQGFKSISLTLSSHEPFPSNWRPSLESNIIRHMFDFQLDKSMLRPSAILCFFLLTSLPSHFCSLSKLSHIVQTHQKPSHECFIFYLSINYSSS